MEVHLKIAKQLPTRPFNKLFGVVVGAIGIVCSTTSVAQEARKIPAAIILPWTEIGVSREIVRLSVPSTTAARDKLVAGIANDSQALGKLADPSMPSTLKNLAEKIHASTELVGQNSITYAPVWCSIADSHVFALVAVDTIKNNIIGLAAHRISRQEWEKKGNLKGQSPIAINAMNSLLSDVKSQIDRRLPSGPNTDALHVALTLGQETTRFDQGSSLCLNLIVSGRLAKDYTVINPIAELRRPTRSILTKWNFQGTKKNDLKFPLSLKLTANYTETVFGQVLGTAQESSWSFIADENGQLSVGVDSGLAEFLNSEKKSLMLADVPQAAKIYGGWVYLDRGRAYGLHMDDRLVAKDASGKEITGHIVGFYGPEMGLKSPRGYLINEGAIMFVRKGQRETALGQAYTFDTRQYPDSGSTALVSAEKGSK